ncbi:MAG TPA: MOSC N-terminal beta barrel domain-containing protein [Caldimonas sp.]|nr:MOSC N-terminal beta barrel domain-containing protein [Caldimonas sp.]HEX4234232.1 MOSC N-terminal beta barrel domain-containing protein [Caldimonas sp.]
MSDIDIRLESIHVYPVKSCAGTSPQQALLAETGFDLDHEWMVVDAAGSFVTQRELPRMALVQTALKGDELILRAPGMLGLHVAADRVEGRTEVEVWGDRVAAYDMGALCAQWFSDFLGRPLRLARFDPEAARQVDRRWAGAIDATAAFQDGFPLLVASTASLAEVNRRLAIGGEAAVTLARFRPNLVLAGLDAHGEDHLDQIVFTAADGPVRLKVVKPCARCPIPDVDPERGVAGHAVGDVLAQYRADPRLGGALTFGMNAIVVEGIGRTLAAGMAGTATIAFA